MKRRALVSSLGALLFSAGAALGVGRLLARRKADERRGGRLVSLSPAITETVLALGGARELAGVSDYCELPADLHLPRLGSSLTPHFEAIARLRPQVILCDDSAGAKRRELAAIGDCRILPWLTLSEVARSTRRIGEILGRRSAAETLASRLETRLGRKPPADAPRVLLLLSYDPDRPAELWFIKRNSLHGAALAAAGAHNAVDRDVPGLPRLGVEELMRLDPDAVLIIPPPGSTPAGQAQMLAALSALGPLRAVKQGKIGVVSGANQSVGPSILGLVDALSTALQKLGDAGPASGAN